MRSMIDMRGEQSPGVVDVLCVGKEIEFDRYSSAMRVR